MGMIGACLNILINLISHIHLAAFSDVLIVKQKSAFAPVLKQQTSSTRGPPASICRVREHL